jgi:uncharacterized protein (DUF433 family)
MLTLTRSPVHSDPEICGGTLVFRGTRVFAQTLLDYMVSGDGMEDFLEDFPSVAREDACDFLKLTYEKDHS